LHTGLLRLAQRHQRGQAKLPDSYAARIRTVTLEVSSSFVERLAALFLRTDDILEYMFCMCQLYNAAVSSSDALCKFN
jgi:hypothetical protein